jgi:hypothetical protein
MSYRDIVALNQSCLKKILQSPKDFLTAVNNQNNDDSTQSHFIFGSVVDLMLTGTREEFHSKYIVVDDSDNPTEGIKLVVDSLFKDLQHLGDITELEDYKTLILSHCNFMNYQSNWKDETRVNKIIDLGKKYFDVLKSSVNKTVVSSIEYSTAITAVAALKSDEFTKYYCWKQPNVEFLDKFIIEFEWQGYNIKGELDRVVVDHVEKTITPIDFKTTGKSVLNFNSDFWFYRYDFQAAVYKYGLTLHDTITSYIDKGYVLKNFLYIVVEKNFVNNPMIFEVTQKVIDIGFSGGQLSNGKKLEGFEQAIERYNFAYQHDKWDYPMEYYTKGKQEIII